MGELKGKKFITNKVIYGLKSARPSFRYFIDRKLYGIGFTLYVDDPDVWIRTGVKSGGTAYYDYSMTYVDSIIALSIYVVGLLEEIARFIRINTDNKEPPSDYLGAVLVNKTGANLNLWTISSQKYVKAIIENVVKGMR